MNACAHCRQPTLNSVYCSNACQAAQRWERTKERLDREGVISGRGLGPRRTARRYVEQRDGSACKLCGGSVWQGQPMPLVLDHVDGNADNWTLSNLRLVCPNCDALLPTFKSRNRGKGRAWRRLRYASGQSY